MLRFIQLILMMLMVSSVQLSHAITVTEATTLLQSGQNATGPNVNGVIAMNDEISLTSLDSSVTGNVLTNDTNATNVSAYLLNTGPDKDAGSYGALQFSSDGNYTYLLYTGSAEIQNLAEGQTLEDVFHYEIIGADGTAKQASLTVRIIGSNNQTLFTARDDVNTITKNAGGGTDGSTIVTGSLTTNDIGAVSTYLVSNPISEIGALTLSTAGDYTYTLYNDVEKVRNLNYQELITDSFEYQIVSNLGNVATATLTINILGAPGQIAGSVEVESNDQSSWATIINSTVAVNEPHYQKGHLMNSSDKDWYYIQSLGNEVLHFDLCPPASSCYNENAWVMYVFDKSKLDSAEENSTVRLTNYGDTTGTVYGTTTHSHMYLNYEFGNYDDALIGIIDPCFGDRTSLDVGVSSSPKEYYIAISSPLVRENTPGTGSPCGSGSVVLKKTGPTYTYNTGEVDPTTGAPVTADESSTIEYIAVEPNSEDQYIFSVIRTGSNPVRSGSIQSARYDSSNRTLDIPKIRVNSDLYTASVTESATARSGQSSTKYAISKFQKLDASEAMDSGTAEYDPSNNIVRIPKYEDVSTGDLYSMILLYHPATVNTEEWVEFIDAYKIN